MYYVYVLKSRTNNDIYVGFTSDLRRRFTDHNKGLSSATAVNRPWMLIYYEAYRHKSDAIYRERQLKNHKAKIDLKAQLRYSLGMEYCGLAERDPAPQGALAKR